MAEISIDRAAFEKLDGGDLTAAGGDERVASFLANKFREGETSALRDEPSWVFNIWTYRF